MHEKSEFLSCIYSLVYMYIGVICMQSFMINLGISWKTSFLCIT